MGQPWPGRSERTASVHRILLFRVRETLPPFMTLINAEAGRDPPRFDHEGGGGGGSGNVLTSVLSAGAMAAESVGVENCRGSSKEKQDH